MTYHVIELDILKGKRCEPGDCPVARSIKRRHPHAAVLVHSKYAYLNGTEVTLPARVQEWISTFDRHMPVNPIRFEL